MIFFSYEDTVLTNTRQLILGSCIAHGEWVQEILSVVSDSRAAALVLGEKPKGRVGAPSCAPSAAPVGCWSSQRLSGSCCSLTEVCLGGCGGGGLLTLCLGEFSRS